MYYGYTVSVLTFSRTLISPFESTTYKKPNQTKKKIQAKNVPEILNLIV